MNSILNELYKDLAFCKKGIISFVALSIFSVFWYYYNTVSLISAFNFNSKFTDPT
ncbi:MAG: hypothetical protein K5978_02335 [Campylobacter sp.]|nr:hypothetical protein [Campylobacter sp.]